MRIVVFDDNAAIGRMIVRSAGLAGLQAVAVARADEFWAEMHREPPDIVMLDLQLGETDGVSQLRKLADAHFRGSIVLITGFDPAVLNAAYATAQSLNLAVDAMLEKPMRAEQLSATFERLMARRLAPSPEQLREAIAAGDFGIELEPVAVREPRTLVAVEALAYWDHPTLGRLLPEVFLPVIRADRTTSDRFTEWLLGAVVETYGFLAEFDMRVPIAMNIGMQALHDFAFPEMVEAQLREGGMPMGHLAVEVTEYEAQPDIAPARDILIRLRLKGMQVTIDDFGAGYSSLKLLSNLAASGIKIDRCFLSNLDVGRSTRMIVKSMAAMAADLGVQCSAKGVEDQATAVLLEELGISVMQGHVIAPAMPVEALPAWLAVWVRTPRPARAAATASDPTSRDVAPAGQMEGETSPPQQETEGQARAHLTTRQMEVLELLAQGCSVKEIARRLGLGLGTVKVHISLAYTTLGAHNRIEAVRRAGLLTDYARASPIWRPGASA